MSNVYGNLSKQSQRKPQYDEATVESMAKHIHSSDNPHSVTPSKIGAYTRDEVDGYVSGLSEQITSNYSDLSEDITNLRTATQQSFDTVGRIVSGKADSDKVYTKEQVDELIDAGGGSSSTPTDKYNYYVASKGLEIEDGVVIGIGSCRDENIIIPEFYTENGEKKPVTAVRSGAFGKLLGNNGSFIKSITFSHNIERFDMAGGHVINSEYCENLEEIYMMNPNITWQDFTYPFRLLENMKDIYFAFTEAEYDKINEGRQYTLITLRNENIQAGKVPTKHFSYFASTVVSKQIGDIESALDELHNYATSLIGGEA